MTAPGNMTARSLSHANGLPGTRVTAAYNSVMTPSMVWLGGGLGDTALCAVNEFALATRASAPITMNFIGFLRLGSRQAIRHHPRARRAGVEDTQFGDKAPAGCTAMNGRRGRRGRGRGRG